MTTPDRVAARTEAGRSLVAQFDVGQFGRVQRAVADIEQQAHDNAIAEAAAAPALDVERLRIALWGMKWEADADQFARKIAAEYARLTPPGDRP